MVVPNQSPRWSCFPGCCQCWCRSPCRGRALLCQSHPDQNLRSPDQIPRKKIPRKRRPFPRSLDRPQLGLRFPAQLRRNSTRRRFLQRLCHQNPVDQHRHFRPRIPRPRSLLSHRCRAFRRRSTRKARMQAGGSTGTSAWCHECRDLPRRKLLWLHSSCSAPFAAILSLACWATAAQVRVSQSKSE